MTEITECLERFIKSVKESNIYQEYENQKEVLKEYPDLKGKIDEFRVRNFRLQTMENSEQLFDETDQFTQEYERLRDIPMVHDFLRKELAYCRMVQEINERILEAFSADFE